MKSDAKPKERKVTIRKEPPVTVDTWADQAGATYDVNVHDGWINATQDQYGQDVLAALAPEDARRLARALIVAADRAATHPRWA